MALQGKGEEILGAKAGAIRTERHEYRFSHVTIEIIEAEKIDYAPVLDEGENLQHSIGAKISSVGAFRSSWRYLGPAGVQDRPCDFASFAPARVPWGTVVSGQGIARGLACRFDEDYFLSTTGLDGKWTVEQLRACQDLNAPRIRGMLDLIYQELSQPGFSSREMVHALCKILLIELSRYIREWRYSSGDNKSYFSKNNIRFLEEYIKSNDCRRIKVKNIADIFDMSEGHFHNRFKSETGMTPNQLIEKVRINRAKEMLSDQNNSIKQIAHAVGFSCQSSFSVAFRRATGETPGRFRSTMGLIQHAATNA